MNAFFHQDIKYMKQNSKKRIVGWCPNKWIQSCLLFNIRLSKKKKKEYGGGNIQVSTVQFASVLPAMDRSPWVRTKNSK